MTTVSEKLDAAHRWRKPTYIFVGRAVTGNWGEISWSIVGTLLVRINYRRGFSFSLVEITIVKGSSDVTNWYPVPGLGTVTVDPLACFPACDGGVSGFPLFVVVTPDTIPFWMLVSTTIHRGRPVPPYETV